MHNQIPQIICLPSSGGHGGSRITPELTVRKRFPFRRYSIQEDGSLVVRTRHQNLDVRSRPYVKPAVRFSTPSSRRASPSFGFEPVSTLPTSTHAPPPDSNLSVELLKSLVPALVEDPTSFEEAISSICAAHDVDESVVSALKQAARRGSSSLPLQHVRALDRSTPPAVASSSSTFPCVSPIKQERPFPSGSPGVTAWFSSHSLTTLREPPPNLDPNVGDLYVHTNRAAASHDVWLCGLNHSWTHVDVEDKVYHPIIAERVLSMRANGTPSWITAASYTTIKGRKEKAKASSNE